jgi:hypothetical protein
MTDRIFVLKMGALLAFPPGIIMSLVLGSIFVCMAFVLLWLVIFLSLPGYRREVEK